MRAFAHVALACGLLLTTALNANPRQVTSVQFEDINIKVPSGWQSKQTARSQGTLIAAFAKGDAYVTMFANDQLNLDMQATFVNGSTVTKDLHDRTLGGLKWQMLHTTKAAGDNTPAAFVAAFKTELNNKLYYGYARSTSAQDAENAAVELLNNMKLQKQ